MGFDYERLMVFLNFSHNEIDIFATELSLTSLLRIFTILALLCPDTPLFWFCLCCPTAI